MYYARRHKREGLVKTREFGTKQGGNKQFKRRSMQKMNIVMDEVENGIYNQETQLSGHLDW